MNFQQVIFKLLTFWTKQGCILHQGHDVETGAGTLNPVTFLRALGPTPYNAVYVEPSRRPQDGRYGTHPSRLQNYHQLQVILKPVPYNFLELYLNSLEVLGLNLSQHDIRFVHDDWENPTIGASGLGWEVWLNGMEVTQLTYFQNIGGLPVELITGEITYGLERIVSILQNQNSVYDIQWNDTTSYETIVHESEYQWGHYNFNHASTKMWLGHFQDFSEEATRLIALNLPIPAYDFVIKCSHAFNMLDARGIISVTERTNYISKIRQLAKGVALAYKECHPSKNLPTAFLTVETKDYAVKKCSIPPFITPLNSVASFLLEIGVEELPATYIPQGLLALKEAITKLLAEENLTHGTIKTYATPRRLACIVEALQTSSSSKVIEKKGPLLALCFDEQGNITPIGKGFLTSFDIPFITNSELLNHDILKIKEIKSKKYLYAILLQKAELTHDILAKHLPKLIMQLPAIKRMRWDESLIEFSRPIRHIVALLDHEVVPFKVGFIHTDKISTGHRLLNKQQCIIDHANNYVSILRSHHVMVDIEERTQIINNLIFKIESELSATVAQKDEVMAQVLFLVEWPFACVGSFDQTFCGLPKELLIAEMVSHQKYFPLLNAQKEIINKFIVITNNQPNETIILGHQKALTPRLSDGNFLFEQDLKVDLKIFSSKLSQIIFRSELGSMQDKVNRITSIAHFLYLQAKDFCVVEDPSEAASLCKIDLGSAVVNEFPELQSIMGSYLAKFHGFSEITVNAIREHSGEFDAKTFSSTGLLLGMADRLDNVISCFSLGLQPSSSSDPYVLKRQFSEILQSCFQVSLPLNFQEIFEKIINILTTQIFSTNKLKVTGEALHKKLQLFLLQRLQRLLQEMSFNKHHIEAVLAKTTAFYPLLVFQKLKLIQEYQNAHPEKFEQLLTITRRVTKLLESAEKDSENNNIDNETAPLTVSYEKSAIEEQIYDVLTKNSSSRIDSHYLPFMHNAYDLLETFLNNERIIHDDHTIRKERLNLLKMFIIQHEQIADFTKILHFQDEFNK
ncbi:Glycine--tRNA ligase [Candidatus Clavichlamydia salmonicola]|uniref:glycine--tRNA ligase subunit beta n=1 Tax=Candidatus Clavichlamydia salmonicola TaxID=469812 RepID=UPI00189155E1|nr:glycine--tRNA ligase subunit beta [Candidatus Clavichlamydia salmonicola]MBF5050469.1 Glycine--tRNA ligase [Candidatus Clavichlamydia salmonicola]